MQKSATTAIEVHDLTVSYSRKPALWGVDFQVPEGKLAGIVGPNGAGKSTLIKAMMGLIPTDSGHVHVFGKPIDQVRTRVAYVPQRGTVDWDFPASVLDVVMMGRYGRKGLFGKMQKQDKLLALECLEKVGMQHYINRQIAQLSGGQQQRVAIARALVHDPDLLLLDEPTNGLDPQGIAEVRDFIRMQSAQGRTIILASHILDEVEKVCTHVSVIKKGNLLAQGTVDELLKGEDQVVIAAADNQALVRMMDRYPGVRRIETINDTLLLHVEEGFDTTALNKFFAEKNVYLSHLVARKKRLEEQFLELTAE